MATGPFHERQINGNKEKRHKNNTYDVRQIIRQNTANIIRNVQQTKQDYYEQRLVKENKDRYNIYYSIGEKVLRKIEHSAKTTKSKLTPKFFGPWTVTKINWKDNPQIVRIIAPRMKKSIACNIKKLKLYNPRKGMNKNHLFITQFDSQHLKTCKYNTFPPTVAEFKKLAKLLQPRHSNNKFKNEYETNPILAFTVAAILKNIVAHYKIKMSCIFDFYAGTGALCAAIHKQIPFVKITAIEKDFDKALILKNKNLSKITVLIRDLEQPQFWNTNLYQSDGTTHIYVSNPPFQSIPLKLAIMAAHAQPSKFLTFEHIFICLVPFCKFANPILMKQLQTCFM